MGSNPTGPIIFVNVSLILLAEDGQFGADERADHQHSKEAQCQIVLSFSKVHTFRDSLCAVLLRFIPSLRAWWAYGCHTCVVEEDEPLHSAVKTCVTLCATPRFSGF